MRTLVIVLLGTLAGVASAQDPTARVLLQRQQQSDDFALQLQQSIQSFRAGPMTPQQRLDFDALQRGQRMNQSDLHYRQQIQQAQPGAPGDDALRRAETDALRAGAAEPALALPWEGEPPSPAAMPRTPLVEPGVATAPVPRRIRIPEGDPGGWVEWKP